MALPEPKEDWSLLVPSATWGESDAHQDRDGDQSAAAGDGVDQSGNKGCSEEQWQENFRRHGGSGRYGHFLPGQ